MPHILTPNGWRALPCTFSPLPTEPTQALVQHRKDDWCLPETSAWRTAQARAIMEPRFLTQSQKDVL